MVLRISAFIGLSFVVLGSANAGTLTPIDLTKSLVSMGSCSTSVGCIPTVAPVATGTYMNNLFTAVDLAATTPTPGAAAQNAITGAGTTPFIMDAQSASPFNDTYFGANTSGLDTSIVVDLGGYTGAGGTSTLGLFNVDQIYTLIQASNTAYGFQGRCHYPERSR